MCGKGLAADRASLKSIRYCPGSVFQRPYLMPAYTPSVCTFGHNQLCMNCKALKEQDQERLKGGMAMNGEGKRGEK